MTNSKIMSQFYLQIVSRLSILMYLRPASSTLRCVIPVVCVTNEREESVVNHHLLPLTPITSGTPPVSSLMCTITYFATSPMTEASGAKLTSVV